MVYIIDIDNALCICFKTIFTLMLKIYEYLNKVVYLIYSNLQYVVNIL